MRGSPLWWVFAALSVLIWYLVMLRAMPTRNHRIFVSFGPPVVSVPVLAYSAKYGDPLVEVLPVYCALVLSVPVGVLGHRKALREVLADPEIPYDEATGPWTLQAGCALALFLGLAIYYVSR
ncbi:hypothetical protein ACFWJE_07705 [Streptomyces griseoincarnatus]|uniref:hypothetical protein n=1 Tax=Streptomyces sp. OS603R TaxID=3035287 RepID=UPI002434A641|nr:hypothetical protein [Streptomyces sp. OS603R]